MAISSRTDTSLALSTTGQNFQQAMDQFACVRSNHSGILGSYITSRIDQCCADFLFSSQSITTISSAAASSWCFDCLKFFKTLRQKEYVLSQEKNKLQNFCTKAQEISEAFKCLSVYIRRIAGDFHDVEVRAEQKAEEALKEVEQVQKIAEMKKRDKDRAHDDAVQTRKDASDTADGWEIAAMTTFWIPGVNIITGVGHAITRGDERSAIRKEQEAYSEYLSADRNLENAQMKYQKAKNALSDICLLNEKLQKVQKSCEAIAGMVSSKANEFSSMYSRGGSHADMIDIGLHQEVADEEIQWLSKMKKELEVLVEALRKAQATHVYLSTSPAALTIRLPTLGIFIE